MTSEQQRFLELAVKPARLNPEQTAWYLGFQPHDIFLLIAKGFLKPLGNPPPNGQKYFATSALDELRQDAKWLARATDALYRHWKLKNGRKRTGFSHRITAASAITDSAESAANKPV